jgi:hypothetical protein
MHKGLFACSVLTTLGLMGCGSSSSGSDPFGQEPDYNEVQGHFDHPDGTFNAANASGVLGNANGSGDANAAGVFTGGSSSSSSGVQQKALKILGGNPQLSCADLSAGHESGSCACPSGGSFDYQLSGAGGQSNADVTMKVHLNACASNDVVVDGSEFLHMTSSKNASGQTDFTMLFVVKATVQKGAETHTLDIAEEYGNGEVRIAVKVDDGWVTVVIKSNGSTGSYEVRDKNGTWTCTYDSTGGSCTSSNGGQPVAFKK